ncbi:MAG: hypothetical protein N2484_12895 [Clostridia bacterium]|nr:hypothetical protein [Clostridia bacterium]
MVTRKTNNNKGFDKSVVMKKLIVGLFWVFVIGILIISESDIDFQTFFQNKSVDKLLKKDSNFVYATSITSEMDNKQRANVYKTKISISETANYIINNVPGIEYADESADNDSLGMLNDKEYVFIYSGEDDEFSTYIQVSSRQYAYTSGNDLYRSLYDASDLYYRDYYYHRAYSTDFDRYGASRVFSNYSSKDFSAMTSKNNTYNNLISSVRQSSIGSRSLSGGGTSFGK